MFEAMDHSYYQKVKKLRSVSGTGSGWVIRRWVAKPLMHSISFDR